MARQFVTIFGSDHDISKNEYIGLVDICNNLIRQTNEAWLYDNIILFALTLQSF